MASKYEFFTTFFGAYEPVPLMYALMKAEFEQINLRLFY